MNLFLLDNGYFRDLFSKLVQRKINQLYIT